jgi:hypothetical protein
LEGFDPLDGRKPPPAPVEWVRAGFPHPDWERRSGEYRRDLRGPGSEGETWEVEVRSSTPGEIVTLEFSEIVPAPSALALRLIDREQGLATDWSGAGPQAVGSAPATAGQRGVFRYQIMSFGPRPYRLALAAGTEDYVARVVQRSLTLPARVTLDPSAPNPFRGATRIRFGLARAEPASLGIYNVLGQRVATLLDRTSLDAGYHTRIWDGTMAGGRAAPSGVYLMRLTAGREALTRRLVLIR